MRSQALVLVLLLAGCGKSSDLGGVSSPGNNDPVDSAVPVDSGVPATGPNPDPTFGDLAMPKHNVGEDPTDGGLSTGSSDGLSPPPVVPPPAPDAGVFVPPAPVDPPVTHGPSVPAGGSGLFAGLNLLDVSVDQGGGVWAVTASTVYYLPPGATAAFAYDQRNGLARGQYTWLDVYYTPGTWPVQFTTIAGGMPGQAVIGNFGAIADRLQVNPTSGAVISVENLAVTTAQATGTELAEHLKRVVAVWKVIVDLNGTFSGTAYFGGWHGLYAMHGMTGNCGCLVFEEHQHYITDTIVGGADVKGLDFTVDGDVWQGDRDFLTFLPQRSKGPNTDFFDGTFAFGLDVFAGVRDEITGVAVDAAGGVYVGSDGNGLAYLQPATHAATYWSSTNALPQNRVRGLALDGHGDLWVGTVGAGIARLHPATQTWTYYTPATGLPAYDINAIYYDKLSGGAKIYVATDNGLAILTP